MDSEKDALKSRKQMEDSRQVRYESHRLFANFMITLNPLFTHGANRKLLVNSTSGHHEGKGILLFTPHLRPVIPNYCSKFLETAGNSG